MGNDEIPEVPSLENFHKLTRKLWVDRIPASISEGRNAMLVVGLKEGAGVGPYAYDVNNTAAIVMHRIGMLDEGEHTGPRWSGTSPWMMRL